MSGPEQTDSDAVDAAPGDDSEPSPAESEPPRNKSDPSPAPSPAREPIVDRLAEYDSVLEVGIGRRPGVACALADRNVDVRAVDVHTQSVPACIEFVQDDVVERAARLEETPQTERAADDDLAAHYRVDAIYALNLPPELQQPTLRIARVVDAAFLFTTLGGDPATVPTRTESVGRDALYVARDR